TDKSRSLLPDRSNQSADRGSGNRDRSAQDGDLLGSITPNGRSPHPARQDFSRARRSRRGQEIRRQCRYFGSQQPRSARLKASSHYGKTLKLSEPPALAGG